MDTSRRRHRIGARAGYDLWADSYDSTPNPVVAMDDRHALGLLGARRGERVLDLGCGTGRYLQRLASVGARPVGADFSLEMLRAARRRVGTTPMVAADLQQALPFDDAVFDATVCALVGEHLEWLDIALREAHRTLCPGGRLVFTVYHPDLAAAGKEANFVRDGVEYRLGAVRWSTGQYLDRLADAGFTDIETWEFAGDEALTALVPEAHHLHGSNVVLALRAGRPVT